MNNNISKPSAYACSGCGACLTVCPEGAITLMLDDAGFYRARVDDQKCIQCGLCTRVCTRYDDTVRGTSLYDTDLYALQSCDREVVQNCSSGGLAHEISAALIRRGWRIAGVVYNTISNKAEHRIITSQDELFLLDGSKYLQSDPGRVFREILSNLKDDQEVRYAVFGTPCQVAGLDRCGRLTGTRDQMLLIEIFCHGVPPYGLWDHTCEKISGKLGRKKFDSVQFRFKKDGWHAYCLKVDAGGRIYLGTREKELFWQVYFENVLLNDSCYACRHRKEISAADIRLGDYWGRRFQSRRDGVSAVFACSEKGQHVIRNLIREKKVSCFEAGEAREMLAAQNMSGYHQKEIHDGAMEVLRNKGNIKDAVKWYRKRLPAKQKLKYLLLALSAGIPAGLRTRIRKYYSSAMLKH